MIYAAPMELWIPITIAAAFLQNIRSAMQKHLKGRMGTTGATFVRFGFGLPVACVYVLILIFGFGFELPVLNGTFAFWLVVAAIAQIAATFLLVYLFSFRNFTVGSAYSRSEPVQTAILASLFFSEVLPVSALLAIGITVVGVMLISVARPKERQRLTPLSLITSLGTRTALIGLASGTLFGLSAVGYRAAALSLQHEQFLMHAVTTLVVAIVLQTMVMLVWMILKDRDEIAKILSAWRPALLVGFVGATATFGWFSAFSLQQAAIVKALAQVEMIFTFASSVFIFKEKVNRLEIIGCLLIVAGILVLFLA
mgnify:CR=1 FL=1